MLKYFAVLYGQKSVVLIMGIPETFQYHKNEQKKGEVHTEILQKIRK